MGGLWQSRGYCCLERHGRRLWSMLDSIVGESGRWNNPGLGSVSEDGWKGILRV
jgi:hypothetical protein